MHRFIVITAATKRLYCNSLLAVPATANHIETIDKMLLTSHHWTNLNKFDKTREDRVPVDSYDGNLRPHLRHSHRRRELAAEQWRLVRTLGVLLGRITFIRREIPTKSNLFAGTQITTTIATYSCTPSTRNPGVTQPLHRFSMWCNFECIAKHKWLQVRTKKAVPQQTTSSMHFYSSITDLRFLYGVFHLKY